MIIPSPTTDELKASVIPYTNFRIALATALLGSVCATVAWLIVLAFETRDPELFITVGVGALIGFIVHWFQHYARVAAREERGESVEHHPHRKLVAAYFAVGFAFLALATEHLVAHMAAKYMLPFMASLASLVPAGAIIGWSMSRGRDKDKSQLLVIVDGMLIGASIAVVTGIIWKIGAFGTISWLALVSWWGLIGVGTNLMTNTERNTVSIGDPIAAVVLVFVGTFLLNLLPDTLPLYDKLGAFKNVPILARAMAEGIQESPGVPGQFWTDAKKRFDEEHAKGKGDGGHGAQQAAQPRRPFVLSPGAHMPDMPKVADNMVHGTPTDTAAARQAKATMWTALWQSWFVILAFAFGAGLAPTFERALRPVDYPNSQTYRYDIRLAKGMILFLVVACVFGRYERRKCEEAKPGTVAGCPPAANGR